MYPKSCLLLSANAIRRWKGTLFTAMGTYRQRATRALIPLALPVSLLLQSTAPNPQLSTRVLKIPLNNFHQHKTPLKLTQETS